MGRGRYEADTEPLTGAVISTAMFLLFSNRLGCAASLLVSVIGTLLILYLLGWVSR